MQTNFFNTLSSFGLQGDLKIHIRFGKDSLAVSILLNNDNVEDAAKHKIPPLNFTGSAADLDHGFFSSLKQPLQKTNELLLNLSAYEKAQEETLKASRQERDKKDRDKKEKDEKSKRFDAQMKKVEELEKEGKFREAYAQLPKASDYPEYEEKLKEKKQFLTEKFEQPSLF